MGAPPDWSAFGGLWRALGDAARTSPWYVGLTPVSWDDLKVDVLAGDGVVVLRAGRKESAPLVEVTLTAANAVSLSESLARFATMAKASPEAAPPKKGK